MSDGTECSKEEGMARKRGEWRNNESNIEIVSVPLSLPLRARTLLASYELKSYERFIKRVSRKETKYEIHCMF